MTISDPTAPDTIVLIHGFWVTPRSWEEWIAYYQDKGYRGLAPAYPGFEVEGEALNADPTQIENLTRPAVTAIGSAVALGEALHPASLVGMLVALAGIGAVLRRDAPPIAPRPPAVAAV